jgi:hypothetical protein
VKVKIRTLPLNLVSNEQTLNPVENDRAGETNFIGMLQKLVSEFEVIFMPED